MVQKLLLISDMLCSRQDLSVLSEVWDKIVSWDFFCFLRNCKLVTMLSLSLPNIKGGKLDIAINAEVRDSVFSWWSFRGIKSYLKFSIHF